MGVYRKKPVAIEAKQYTGLNGSEIAQFISAGICEREELINGKWIKQFEIQTLEGPHIATQGDFIIKGVQGEFYPCKPDIFRKTYESAETNKMCGWCNKGHRFEFNWIDDEGNTVTTGDNMVIGGIADYCPVCGKKLNT